MNGGLSRRRARAARAAHQAPATIEREKIRRPQPVEPEFADERQPAGDSPIFQPDDDVHDDLDWTDGGAFEADLSSEQSAWDEDPEADWVLSDGGEEDIAEDDIYAEDEEEAGVIWEENAPSDQVVYDEPDDIAFEDDDPGYMVAPEVELAGRRDVSPKAPKPAPSSRQKARRQGLSRQAQPRARKSQLASRPQMERESFSQPAKPAPPPRQAAFEAAPPPARTYQPPPQPIEMRPVANPPASATHGGRGARPRASLGAAEALIVGDDRDEVVQPPRGGTSGRRRQTQSGLSFPPNGLSRAMPRGRRSGKGLVTLAFLIVLGVGGWFGYQRIDPEAIQPVIDRLTSIIPFPGSTRTASDSSFSEEAGSEALSAERALSDLEERVREQSAISQADGPPIPKFKPLPDEALPRAQSTTNAEDVAQPADANDEVTILEQILRYINPG